jgi:hypothetical protein
MTREEANALEGDIANDVLNNFPLSGLVMLATDAAKKRANQIMDESTDEALTDMQGKYAEAKAKLEAEKAKQEATGQSNADSNITEE